MQGDSFIVFGGLLLFFGLLNVLYILFTWDEQVQEVRTRIARRRRRRRG